MRDSVPAGDSPSPASATATLERLLQGAVVTQALYVTAKLGLADLLADGPKSSADLALAARAHAPSLHRLLRFLVSLGVLSQETNERFGLTPLSHLLRREGGGSLRTRALVRGDLAPLPPGDEAREQTVGAPTDSARWYRTAGLDLPRPEHAGHASWRSRAD
jgi:Dimerisation domain